MKKIPTLFVRDFAGNPSRVLDEVTPGCEWVLAGEGIATVKIDGTACLWRDGKLWGRYDAKRGRSPSASFVPAQPEPDPITGSWPGWVPIEETAFAKAAAEALPRCLRLLVDGHTYELVGPKINGNPEDLEAHELTPHGIALDDGLGAHPLSFNGIRAFLTDAHIEGIVWWRDPADRDCDKAKIKRRDFGLPWPMRDDA